MSKQTLEDVNIEITFRKNAGDMNAAEMLREYATLLAEKENNEHWNGTTHYAGCVGAGPKHYECALQEIGRLRLTITHLRAELAKKAWVGLTDDEIEHLRNDQPWWMVRDIEAKLKEKNCG